MSEFDELLIKAQKVYLQNFKAETCFERAIFFSWDCSIKDCGFCYMSAHTKRQNSNKIARRSTESMLAEVISCKKMGWELGFVSGGINAFTQPELKELLEKISITYGQKVWLNAGPIPMQKLEELAPFLKGVVGSIETINSELHKKVCPSKPTLPYEQMFESAKKIGLKTAMTFIIGLGETIEDFDCLKKFIQKYDIDKIHFYSLIPHKGTMFENAKIPSAQYQAEWIAKTRIEFPKIDIQCGIWSDRVDRINLLLKAGANTISKFQAITKFGTQTAHQIEEQATKSQRKFNGTLTKFLQINAEKEVEELPFEKELKQKIKNKLIEYVEVMKKSARK